MRFCLLCLIAFAVLSTPAAAQPLEPGDGFEWERLGDPAFDTYFLTVAPDGVLWGGGNSIDYDDGIYYYSESEGWRDTTNVPNDPDALAFLGPDTLLAAVNIGIHRSVDGGETWRETAPIGHERILHVAPLGLPRSGGRIFADAARHTDGLAYSTDRGRRFTPSTYDSTLFGTDDIRSVTALAITRGPHAGRVVEGAMHGIAYSDDGGESFRPSSLWHLYRFRSGEIIEGEGPDGQHRLFALHTDATQHHDRVIHSDDGGETWSEPTPLPEVQDGVGSFPSLVWLGPAGQPQSVLAILPRGHIYRTDDGGGTWHLTGRAPVPFTSSAVQDALVDAGGRLVVAAPHSGGAVNGVFRTVNPVAVASAPAPPETPDLGVRIEPNPTTGSTAARWRQSSAGAARVSVFDARGREVLVLSERHRQPGENVAEVDTSALSPGVYVVRVATAEGNASARFTVAR